MELEFVDRAPEQPGRPQVRAVGSRRAGPAYDRLDECDLEVVAVAPHLGAFEEAELAADEVVLVGCTETMLLTPAFQARVAALSRAARTIAVVPGGTGEAAAHAARLGFHGFVPREVPPRAIERTVHAVRRGELAFPRSALTTLIRQEHELRPPQAASLHVGALTPRQRQIVELIARGATDRDIARILRISRSTAHKHVQNALRRTNARTRSQLAASTRQSGAPLAHLAERQFFGIEPPTRRFLDSAPPRGRAGGRSG